MSMTFLSPKIRVARASNSIALDEGNAWAVLEKITPFVLADGSAPALQQTTVRVCFDDDALYVRFDCEDRDIWGTYTQRDEPLFNQEVVEVMIAAGEDIPTTYFEFEISPNGVLFDAMIFNSNGSSENLKWDANWNCPNLRWHAERDDAHAHWSAVLAIPWRALTNDARVPNMCRANFYRIERPRDSETEYSCWSPTLTNPADFHRPARFGILEFDIGGE